MQFAFSYFYFIIHSQHKQNITEFLEIIDTNSDGEYSKGELNILLSYLFDLPVAVHNRTQFWSFVESCSNSSNIVTLGPHNIHQCANLSTLIDTAMNNITTYPHEIVDDKDVTFKMLKSNSTKVRTDLDYVRRSPKKFICLNDNMDHGSSLEHTENIHQLAEFYQTMFPNPSPFEHSSGKENTFLYKSRDQDNILSCSAYTYFCMLFYVTLAIGFIYSFYLKRRTISRMFKLCILRFL